MMAPHAREPGHSWHFILADLALILFLLTVRGMAIEKAQPATARQQESAPPDIAIAPAQAIFRPVPGGPAIAAWLASQPQDPRATLTIFARYPPGGEAIAWQDAGRLAREAGQGKVAIRAIIARGSEADLYASLAYDTVQADQP